MKDQLAALKRDIDHLQSALNQKESLLFSMWTVLNTLLHLLKEKELYTEQEFVEVGNRLRSLRAKAVQEVMRAAKENGRVVQPDEMPRDLLATTIEKIKE